MAANLLQGLSRGLAVFALASGGLIAALMAGPDTGPVAAVFPPWWDGVRVIAAASDVGPVLRFGLLDFIVLIAPDQPASRDRLRRAGAWLLLNPRGLAGCALVTGAKSNGT